MPEMSIIPNGTWTISSEYGRRTFDIATQEADAEFAPGERIIGLLTGPDNVNDFQSFGFVKNGNRVIVWKKFRGDGKTKSEFEKYAMMVATLFALEAAGKPLVIGGRQYYINGEGTCLRCNRKLTTPESVARGMGPDCASK